MLKEETITVFTEHYGKIVAVATKFLVPLEGSEESKDPRRMADAYAAVSVVVSMCNIFSALYSENNNFAMTAIVDLTFALNSNTFWVKNAGYFMPLVNAAVNAAQDFRDQELVDEPVWETMKQHNRMQWLEILPAVVFLASGYVAMRKYSLEMKKTFVALV